MFQNIVFQTPTIIFGIDAINQIGEQAKKLGAGRALLITGPRVEKAGVLDKVRLAAGGGGDHRAGEHPGPRHPGAGHRCRGTDRGGRAEEATST